MLKKTVTYIDYNGNQRTEDFYFNLTRAEVTKMELEREGGLAERLTRIINASDGPEIMRQFNQILMTAYGIKSDDGRRFEKSAAISEEFAQTEAYSQIFMELATDAQAASEFINAIMPKDDAPAPTKTNVEQIAEQIGAKVENGNIIGMPTNN